MYGSLRQRPSVGGIGKCFACKGNIPSMAMHCAWLHVSIVIQEKPRPACKMKNQIGFWVGTKEKILL